jgi:hypothetical protein
MSWFGDVAIFRLTCASYSCYVLHMKLKTTLTPIRQISPAGEGFRRPSAGCFFPGVIVSFVSFVSFRRSNHAPCNASLA